MIGIPDGRLRMCRPGHAEVDRRPRRTGLIDQESSGNVNRRRSLGVLILE